jgi:hypothetical protein
MVSESNPILQRVVFCRRVTVTIFGDKQFATMLALSFSAQSIDFDFCFAIATRANANEERQVCHRDVSLIRPCTA